jgi:hypothetical protein
MKYLLYLFKKLLSRERCWSHQKRPDELLRNKGRNLSKSIIRDGEDSDLIAKERTKSGFR